MRGIVIILSLLSGSAASAAEPEIVLLKPSNNWELNYASERCRLTRTFGAGDSIIYLTMERFEPGVQFRLILGGSPLRSSLRAEEAQLRFGPAEQIQKLSFKGGTGSGVVPLWIFNGSVRIAGAEPSMDSPARPVTPERESAVTYLDVGKPLKKIHRLETGSMGPAFAALRKCTDEVLAHWGFDVEQHRNMTRRPTPIGSPGDWVKGSDYPANLAKTNVNGLVEFRIDVDESGGPTACHIQKAVRTIGFNEAVCDAVMRRAKFAPALDAEGKPMRSYWRNTVWFEVG